MSVDRQGARVSAVLNVLVLAVISAISPAILAVLIVVLSRPNPRRLLLAYLLGGMLASIAVGFAVVLALSESQLLTGSSPAADPIVNFTVGALALIVAYVLATDRDANFEERRRKRRASRPPRDPWSERILSRETSRSPSRSASRSTCPAPSISSPSRTSPRTSTG